MSPQVPRPAANVPAIPFKQASPAINAATTSGGAVLVVSLLAIAIVFFLRKRLNLGRMGEHGSKRIRVLETQMLGPRTMLAVVEFGGREHLIAQTEHGVSCIADIEAERRA
jgi:flagellar biosynthetic protein FliO